MSFNKAKNGPVCLAQQDPGQMAKQNPNSLGQSDSGQARVPDRMHLNGLKSVLVNWE